jgi:GlpG protein
MRQITTLPDPQLAQRLADHLLTLDIETQLMDEAGQVAVWVRDEDRVAQARQELEDFLRNPADARYGKASAAARTRRKQDAASTKEYQRKQSAFEEKMADDGAGEVKVITFSLVLISVVLTLASNFATDSSPVTKALSIASYSAEDRLVRWYGLRDIEHGEVWRLVTPIFLHLDLMHLVFNMLALLALGTRVEATRGRLRLVALVLVVAVLSNVAEYYLSWSLEDGPKLELRPSPLFGGMSGVLYGLFGYMWMKSRYEPELGLYVPTDMVVIMLGWFFLCAAGVIGNVANIAHAAGLVSGIVIGMVPRLWRRAPQREPEP